MTFLLNNRNKIIQGKNCMITGATGGLGKQIAIQFAENNCNLILISRNRKDLKNLQKSMVPYRNNIDIYYEIGDLCKIKDIQRIIKNSKSKLGTIDILVNCAGIFPMKLLTDSTIRDFDECFNLNVRAPFLLSKEFARDMMKNKWGRIVNIGSSSSYAGFKKTSMYCATKHAILGFSRAIYEELKDYNVRTYCVSPGSMKTKMGRRVKGQDFKTFINPREVAEFIVYLISFEKEMISEEIRLSRMIMK